MHSANHKFDRPGEAEASIKKKRSNNYSQVSDGAATVLIMKRSIAMQKGLPILGVFSDAAIVIYNSPEDNVKQLKMFDKERIAKLKKGVLIVNNARGAIMDIHVVIDACNNGHIATFGDHTPENLLTDFGLYDPYWLLDIAII
ncbi:hypothetical protein H5410_036934 [Solanum commersonii]|uniref:D-isomer specific 2-hydroxyacid dehydrogenase NAD-binding domain-containing protein n=1 Tax=Solanum commersonii TaxID=4109 RepID=A0A9J5Y9P3_SOLCO|nr:hypothetical protein H5410_036934 [Solanum commersonii]